MQWLCGLGLAKYGDAFVREEIDWDTLQWLTEEVSILKNCCIFGCFSNGYDFYVAHCFGSFCWPNCLLCY